jgi:hypothetical protein
MAGLSRQLSLKDYWGGAPGLIRKLPLASSQTYVEGDLLVINGSGALTIVSHTGGTATGNVPSGIQFAGIANVPAVNDLGASYGWGQFTMWQPGLLMLLPLVYNNAGTLTAASSVFNPDLIGSSYEIYYGGGYPCVDINHTSNAYVKIVDVWAEDYPLWGATNGTWPTGNGTVQYPWVWCECLSSCALLW